MSLKALKLEARIRYDENGNIVISSPDQVKIDAPNGIDLGITSTPGLNGKLTVDGGAKISVQNKVDGGSGQGIFLWENKSEQCLMPLTGDTGDLYTKGDLIR